MMTINKNLLNNMFYLKLFHKTHKTQINNQKFNKFIKNKISKTK